MTMPELLEKLIMQAKVEAREALRQLVAALNGVAGLCILKGEVGHSNLSRAYTQIPAPISDSWTVFRSGHCF